MKTLSYFGKKSGKKSFINRDLQKKKNKNIKAIRHSKFFNYGINKKQEKSSDTRNMTQKNDVEPNQGLLYFKQQNPEINNQIWTHINESKGHINLQGSKQPLYLLSDLHNYLFSPASKFYLNKSSLSKQQNQQNTIIDATSQKIVDDMIKSYNECESMICDLNHIQLQSHMLCRIQNTSDKLQQQMIMQIRNLTIATEVLEKKQKKIKQKIKLINDYLQSDVKDRLSFSVPRQIQEIEQFIEQKQNKENKQGSEVIYLSLNSRVLLKQIKKKLSKAEKKLSR